MELPVLCQLNLFGVIELGRVYMTKTKQNIVLTQV